MANPKGPAREDVTGRRFGRLVVGAEAEPRIRSYPGREVHRQRRVFCRCDCGETATPNLSHLRSGRTTSCGCVRRETVAARRTTHGETIGGRSAEYSAWKAMKKRCFCKTGDDFKNYGGRGITVCDRWRDSFVNFLADMGRRPSPEHSIDRFPDNDGNYEPDNCRWATDGEQARNRRNNRIVEYLGEKMPLVDACAKAGVNYQTAIDRLGAGWPEGRALGATPR